MKANEIEIVDSEAPKAEDLELVVIEKSVGVLTTNIDALEKFIDKRLEDYKPENYKGDADLAKKDRAELNNAKAKLSRTRIDLTNEFMKQLTDLEKCKSCEKKIEQASKALDEIVKIRDEQEKEKKRELIELFWEKQNCTIVPLEKVFNPKWLNKTCKESDILNEMEVIVHKIYDNLKTLERYADDVETLKAHYLMTLDIEETFQYGDELQRQKEIAQKEAEERAEREHAEKLGKQKEELWKEASNLEKKHEIENLAMQAISSASGEEVQRVRKQFVVTVNCFDEELIKLKEAMNELGIEFTARELTF